jgi:hypothetical protein
MDWRYAYNFGYSGGCGARSDKALLKQICAGIACTCRAKQRLAATYVRFTPESGHVQCTSSCLLWANSGHLPIMGQPGQSPKMRSGEPPCTTRRRLKSVAVEKATNFQNVILRQALGAAVLPLGVVDFGPIERGVAFRSN